MQRDPLPRDREPAAARCEVLLDFWADPPAADVPTRPRRPVRPTPSINDFTAEEDRLGFFGPDSVTWRIHSDPAFSVGGLRALLLQALHPVAMDGVAGSPPASRDEPWARLTRTAEYVDTLTFGTRREALRAVRRVRGMHRDKSAVEETTGRAYRVDDADLLLWVHCCEVESLLSTARRAGVPLTAAEADRYVEEQVVGGGAHRRRRGRRAPDGRRARRLLRRRSAPALAVTPAARAASRFILLPPDARLGAAAHPRPPGVEHAGLAGAATLPPLGPPAVLAARARADRRRGHRRR